MVISPVLSHSRRETAGFSLIEMVVVVAVMVVLLTAGVVMTGGAGAQARKAGVDCLTGLVERARAEAVTSGAGVMLAVAEPGDLEGDDGRCRVALFRLDELPVAGDAEVGGVLLGRWRVLEQGVVLLGGGVDGVGNPLDAPELRVSLRRSGGPVMVEVHALVIHPGGGLVYPPGSSPLMVRVADGRYQNGRAVADRRKGGRGVAENRLKIGRVIARPYRIDG